MLDKKHRLAKTKDIKTILGRGRGFFYPYFTIKYAKTAGINPRFTVVVSTKVSKKAVARNRIKRIVREYVRLRMNLFPNGDYVVIIKPKAAAIGPQNLRSSLHQAFTAARLLK